MLLDNKNALIFGAGGSLGVAISKAFAKQGANLFVSGRTAAPVERLVKDIVSTGGNAVAAVVDALDEKAVDKYVASVAASAGSIDICFNLISLQDVQGVPLYEMLLEDYSRPITRAMQSHFLTARAVAKYMVPQHSGIILTLTATPGGVAYPLTGGFGVACNLMEAFSRNLASELGPKGIRVIAIRSAGSPDSEAFIKMMEGERTLAKNVVQHIADDTMLKRLPLLQEIANVAVFAASDHASGMTGTTLNVTCGTTMD
jgi:3-oxoacyl-[acyl-carrier protein] reductase